MESIGLNKPHLIIMVGIPGSGKSFFAEHFADSFKAPIISTDEIRNKLFKDVKFSKEEDLIVNTVANYLLDELLKTNRTIIFRGETATKSDRLKIFNKCRNAGYEPLCVWVQTDVDTSRHRLIKKIGTKLFDNNKFEKDIKNFSAPNILSEKPVVISGKYTYNSQLKIVLKHLVGHNRSINTKPQINHLENRHHLIR